MAIFKHTPKYREEYSKSINITSFYFSSFPTLKNCKANPRYVPTSVFHDKDIFEIKEDHTMKAYMRQINSWKKKIRLQIIVHGAQF